MASVEAELFEAFLALHGLRCLELPRLEDGPRRGKGWSIDYAVSNPSPQDGGFCGEFYVFPTTLRTLRLGVVSLVTSEPPRADSARLPDFLARLGCLDASLQAAAAAAFPSDDDTLFTEITRLVLLPSLPEAEDQRGMLARTLREHGVDGVLTLRTILLAIVEQLEPNTATSLGAATETIRLLMRHRILPQEPPLSARGPKR